ncbi:tail fiber domain-containing protein [Janthinobacterium fluminis]|uniref:Tail fiber domain-containing protein n=1 Tax=Janthinobacterium fluminis TaxID=2987524 RepID=A0ABT5JU51_9BURK|nr:tail fiber domain-containing protein [Janthinobacterium fluminis]MDC8756271.1 tail fiber domain-containing protein [Janthinobacterium fluminis]
MTNRFYDGQQDYVAELNLMDQRFGAALDAVPAPAASAAAAAESAAAALASENHAHASELAAAASAAAAGASEDAAEVALNSFGERYLGAKPVAPAADNHGGALMPGALYWDAVLNGGCLRVWAGGGWNTVPTNVAEAVACTPSGGIAATDVQAALVELDAEKEPGIAPGTAAQYWRGDKSWRDLAADVRGAALSGLSLASGTAVAAADTILVAMGKLQKQIADLGASKVNIANPATMGALTHTGEVAITGNLIAYGTIHAGRSGMGDQGYLVAFNPTNDAYLRLWNNGGVSYLHSTYSASAGAKPFVISVGSSINPVATFRGGEVLLDASLTIRSKSSGWSHFSADTVAQSYMTFACAGASGSGPAAGFIGTDGGAIVGGGAGINFGIRATKDLILQSDNGTIRPFIDGQSNLGIGSYRWGVIYSTTGAINTSDAREKTPVRGLTAAEIAAAKALASEIGAYRWLSAVADKAGAARDHIGMTVQRAIEVMTQHGLDPFRYGFICFDEWAEAENVDTGVPTPAGSRYAFRFDELNLFLARGFEARLAALEAA